MALLYISKIYGQPSILVVGPDETLDCSKKCTNLKAEFPDIRSTNSYSVESIPHNTPIAYNQANGTTLNIGDEKWSKKISLPFSFCFYESVYDALLIGSNGNISFDLSREDKYCPYNSTKKLPSNNLGATLFNSQTPTTPGNIFGVYHDINPNKCGKINYYIIGNEPNRKFVVSYNEVCQYSCTTLKSTSMIVLHETTNIIEIFVKSKPTCFWTQSGAWNDANAIIGIQNMDGSEGIAPPGRNNETPTSYDPNKDWSITIPEAWRFKPNGTALYDFAWFQGTTNLGSKTDLEVCPTTLTTYTAKYTYTKCGATSPTILTDDLIVKPANGFLQVNSAINSSLCGQANGSVTLTSTGGSGVYEYSSDNITYNSVNSFSGLAAGNYTFYIRDNNGCSVTHPLNVLDQSTLVASFSGTKNVTCYGNSDGAIEINATGGLQPYNFSMNGGSTLSSASFNGLVAGQYKFVISDSEGCKYNLSTNITEPSDLNLSLSNLDSAYCNLANASLSLIASGGQGSLNYSIDDFISQQPIGFFNSLEPKKYLTKVRDSNGCADTLTVFVPSVSSVELTLIDTKEISCNGASDGQISVLGLKGELPYSYQLNNGVIQSSSIFSNLKSGNFKVYVSDLKGCIDSIETIIQEPTPILLSVNKPSTVCAGDSVSLEASATGGKPPFSFLWNGTSTGDKFIDYPIVNQSYTLNVKDFNGCSKEEKVDILVSSKPEANFSVTPKTGFEPINILISNQTANANLYEWDFGNGQKQTNFDLNPINITYNSPGVYIIKLFAHNEFCSNSKIDSVLILPLQELKVEVPNVFSPNGDGINEMFSLIISNAKSIEAIIIDRWGNKMFEITDLNSKWDGKNKTGEDAMEGVYFVKYKVIGFDNQQIQGQAFFHLTR
jgi:gliding motility-associated-like protein